MRGKKVIHTSVEIHVNEYTDCDVSVDYDDFVKNLSDDDKKQIFSTLKIGRTKDETTEMIGISLRLFLCDIADISYHSSLDKIFSELTFKIGLQ